jgi:small subunit ribosomal protein S7
MRKKRATRRRVIADPKFNDVLVSRFINSLLMGGKKHTARGILYTAMEQIAQKTEKDPLDVFRKAMDNASPLIEVRARRVGGATYHARRNLWRKSLQQNYWLPLPVRVEPSRKKMTSIAWRKRIRLLRIISGN